MKNEEEKFFKMASTAQQFARDFADALNRMQSVIQKELLDANKKNGRILNRNDGRTQKEFE